LTLRTLHRLIQSLSINELSFFKSHYKLKEVSKKKDRLEIFEFLRKNKYLDTRLFTKKFKSLNTSRICSELTNTIVDHLLLYHKAQNATQSIQLFFQSRYLSSIGKFKDSLKCSEKLLKSYETDIVSKDFNFFGYVNTLNNLIHKHFSFNNLSKIKGLIAKFDVLKDKIGLDQLKKALFYYRYFNCLFQYNFLKGDTKTILSNQKEVNEIIAELKNEIPIYNTFTLWYFMGISHFYSGKYSKAQEHFKLLIDHKSIKDRRQIESIAKMLDFVCTIETNKELNSLVKSKKRSVNNYFKKHSFNYKTDELLLKMLNKVCYLENYNRKQKAEILKSYHPQFKKLIKSEPQRIKDLGIFEYIEN